MSVGFSGVGGVDITQVKPIFFEGAFVPTAGVWTTLVSKTGKGFLTKALVHNPSSNLISLRITIDGTVVFYGQGYTTSTMITGLLQEKEIIVNAGALAVRQPASNSILTLGNYVLTNYPYATAQGGFVIISEPQYFNKSLLIEVFCSASQSANYVVKGGSM